MVNIFRATQETIVARTEQRLSPNVDKVEQLKTYLFTPKCYAMKIDGDKILCKSKSCIKRRLCRIKIENGDKYKIIRQVYGDIPQRSMINTYKFHYLWEYVKIKKKQVK